MTHYIQLQNKYSIWFLIGFFILLVTSCSEGDSAFNSSESSGVGGSMARFTIAGNYMYTVDNQSLNTFDLSVPDQPKHLKGKEQAMGFGIETIFAMDSLLFIGSQNGMYIYNITRKEFPQQLSFISHIRSCDPVVASGNYAYVTLNSENTWCGRVSNVLQIYDISDPKNPLLLKTESAFIHPKGLGVDGNKLFICDNGLKVFDISNPASPLWVDDLSHIAEANGISTYDVIPIGGNLLVTGPDGLYQFSYKEDRLSFISKIEVNKEND